MSRARGESYLRLIVSIIAAAIYLIPIFWMVITSLKPAAEIFTKPLIVFPTHIELESYKQILGLPSNKPALLMNNFVFFKNSLIIALDTTMLTLILAIPAAYAVSRFRFRGKTSFLLFLLVAQMLPSVLLVIPLFVLFKFIGVINTYMSVILADTALAVPFAIIILRPTFAQIPKEIEEAAWIDGGTRVQVLWYIVLPLVRAGMVAVGVFSFLTAWGEFVFALSFLQKTELQPVSIGIFQFVGMYKVQWDSMMAFSTLVAIPAIIAFMFLQRQFISGLTVGSVK